VIEASGSSGSRSGHARGCGVATFMPASYIVDVCRAAKQRSRAIEMPFRSENRIDVVDIDPVDEDRCGG